VSELCDQSGNDRGRPREAILSAMATIAKAMSIDVIAAGVTTKEQAQFLVEHGIEIAQGDLFYPRLSKENVQLLWDKGEME